MIHIIVLILKIIGIILLILLGLLLLTVITVLLVPIRYQGHGSYYGTLEGEGQVSWLFHSVRAVITLSDSGPDIRVFLLWKQLGSGEKDHGGYAGRRLGGPGKGARGAYSIPGTGKPEL